MLEIVVYLPGDWHPSTATIATGSAIVGRPESGSDTIDIYFEGNLQKASNIRTYADRAYHACDRLLQNYPTTAKEEAVPRLALTVVGVFDPKRRRIILTGPVSERAVADWIGVDQLDRAELEASRG